MPRLTREDWLTAGLRLLTERGAPALTIDNLTQALQITKGSFYHHFGDFAAYKTMLLTFFEKVHTQDVMTMLEHEHTPLHKLQRLFATVALAPTTVERGVRAWSFQDDEVRSVQARIDHQRIAYVQGLCNAARADVAQPQHMEQLAYIIFVGAQQIQPPLPAENIEALFDEFCRLYHLT